jgi:hypothetical protein
MASLGIIGHQTRTLEWKFYTAKQLGPKLVFPPILVVNWVSSCLSFFLSAFTAATYIFTAPVQLLSLVSYLVHGNAEFQHFISYWDLIKFPYFADTAEKRDRGWKPAQRQGEGRVTLEITVLALVGPCPHRDRDYCIESNFWRFYLH